MIRLDFNGVARTASHIKLRKDDLSRSAYIIKVRIGNVMYTVWEAIRGFLFTSDGFSGQFQDGFIDKLNDQ